MTFLTICVTIRTNFVKEEYVYKKERKRNQEFKSKISRV